MMAALADGPATSRQVRSDAPDVSGGAVEARQGDAFMRDLAAEPTVLATAVRHAAPASPSQRLGRLLDRATKLLIIAAIYAAVIAVGTLALRNTTAILTEIAHGPVHASSWMTPTR